MPLPEVHTEGFDGWLVPHQALQMATVAFGDERIAKGAILEALRGGQLSAAAQTSSWEGGRVSRETGEIPIPKVHWTHIRTETSLSHFWVTGQIQFYHAHLEGIGDVTIRCFGVRFYPAGIERLLADAPVKEAGATRAPLAIQNQGGRPRKDWWDDFWIAICGEIYEGRLNPNTQAELADAMLQWVENRRDADVGETTIKAAARKLFNAWKLGVKN